MSCKITSVEVSAFSEFFLLIYRFVEDNNGIFVQTLNINFVVFGNCTFARLIDGKLLSVGDYSSFKLQEKP